MTTERLHYLLDLYLSLQLTAAEEQEFYSAINAGGYDEELKIFLGEKWNELKADARMNEEQSERILQYILERRPAITLPFWKQKHVLRRFSVAASIASLLFISIFYFVSNNRKAGNSTTDKSLTSHTKNDIAPGQTGAILRLADGTSLVLDSMKDGVLSQQGNALAVKQGGELSYMHDGNTANQQGFNSVETPRGRQFQLRLGDGTQVWLNAASSIRFPLTFTGQERRVEITGEVYFEVAKNKAKPFIVKTGDMQVEVLGTHFNVNAYGDEAAIKTTLIEGSVRISNGKSAGILKPGQQAQASGTGKLQIRDHADIEEILSWKNGRIAFTNAGLESIMRQVSKWYDVDVEYAGSVADRTFTADISRNTNLSEFLKVLELSNIHFRIDGRKLIVLP